MINPSGIPWKARLPMPTASVLVQQGPRVKEKCCRTCVRNAIRHVYWQSEACDSRRTLAYCQTSICVLYKLRPTMHEGTLWPDAYGHATETNVFQDTPQATMCKGTQVRLHRSSTRITAATNLPQGQAKTNRLQIQSATNLDKKKAYGWVERQKSVW